MFRPPPFPHRTLIETGPVFFLTPLSPFARLHQQLEPRLDLHLAVCPYPLPHHLEILRCCPPYLDQSHLDGNVLSRGLGHVLSLQGRPRGLQGLVCLGIGVDQLPGITFRPDNRQSDGRLHGDRSL